MLPARLRLSVILPTLGLGLGLTFGMAHAGPEGHNKKTAKRAVAACKNKQKNDDCSFKVQSGDKAGKCRPTPRGKLACVPHEMHQRWVKAQHACQDKKSGDACEWSHQGNAHSGTCTDLPNADGLVCRER